MRDLNKFMNGALAEKMELAMVEVADNILDPNCQREGAQSGNPEAIPHLCRGRAAGKQICIPDAQG